MVSLEKNERERLLPRISQQKFDYLNVTVCPRLFARIPVWFREEYFPAYWLWPCLRKALTYRAEALVPKKYPWNMIEDYIFLLEYSALFALTWFREAYVRYR